MPTAIETAKQCVYDTLLALGSDTFHDRPTLAAAMHKRWLNPTDVAALDLLAAEGRIEKQPHHPERLARGSNVTRWMYRVVSE